MTLPTLRTSKLAKEPLWLSIMFHVSLTGVLIHFLCFVALNLYTLHISDRPVTAVLSPNQVFLYGLLGVAGISLFKRSYIAYIPASYFIVLFVEILFYQTSETIPTLSTAVATLPASIWAWTTLTLVTATFKKQLTWTGRRANHANRWR